MEMKAEEMPTLVPEIFEHEQFGKVRVIYLDGTVWFVGKDVATALGYADPYAALKQHMSPTSSNALSTQKSSNKWRQNQKVANHQFLNLTHRAV